MEILRIVQLAAEWPSCTHRKYGLDSLAKIRESGVGLWIFLELLRYGLIYPEYIVATLPSLALSSEGGSLAGLDAL